MPSFNVDANIDVEFEVYCGTCGAGLCGQSDAREGRRGPRVDVEACEKCTKAAREEGAEDAWDEANTEIETLKERIAEFESALNE